MGGPYGAPIGREPGRLTGRPRGLQAISDQARAVGRMVYEENRSRADVAKELGLTISCVRHMHDGASDMRERAAKACWDITDPYCDEWRALKAARDRIASLPLETSAPTPEEKTSGSGMCTCGRPPYSPLCSFCREFTEHDAAPDPKDQRMAEVSIEARYGEACDRIDVLKARIAELERERTDLAPAMQSEAAIDPSDFCTQCAHPLTEHDATGCMIGNAGIYCACKAVPERRAGSVIPRT